MNVKASLPANVKKCDVLAMNGNALIEQCHHPRFPVDIRKNNIRRVQVAGMTN
jgi:hypothetical protein